MSGLRAAPLSEELQRLLDRAAIHDLHARYFQGCDACDRAQVRACFTDSVEAIYHGRAPVHGIDALMDSIALWPKLASGELRISTHFMGNLVYRQLERDRAETEVNAFAFLVEAATPREQVAMRCLRYIDRLVKVDAEWRIRERLHTLDWSCTVPIDYATPFVQRKSEFEARVVPAS